jgi:hypothetical protein
MKGELSVKCVLFKEKIMLISQLIKSNHRVLSKRKVDTHGAPVFATDYSTTVVATEMCTIHYEHSI